MEMRARPLSAPHASSQSRLKIHNHSVPRLRAEAVVAFATHAPPSSVDRVCQGHPCTAARTTATAALQVSHDERRRKPQHAVTQTMKLAVAAGVRRDALRMIAAVHFHHEPHPLRHEVDDEAGERELAAKRHAELAAAERGPEPRFTFRWSGAVLSCVVFEARRRLPPTMKLPSTMWRQDCSPSLPPLSADHSRA